MKGGKFGSKLTPEDRSELIQLRREGATYRELAVAFNITTAAVGYHIRQAGLVQDLPAEPRLTPADTGRASLPFTREPWMSDAPCNQVDPDLWFSEADHALRIAKATCSRCDVRARCLTYALDRNEDHGIWGGLTPKERLHLTPHRLETA